MPAKKKTTKKTKVTKPTTENETQMPAKRPVGRPPKEGAFRVNVQARVPEEVADACQKLGGTPFIRQLLTIAADNYKEQIAMNDHMREVAIDAVLEDVMRYVVPEVEKVTLPHHDYAASCGHPSPAVEGEGQPFSFYEYLVHLPGDTFVMNAQGDSMTAAGIEEDDRIVINRSIEARNGDIVLAFINGDVTLKRLKVLRGNIIELHPESLMGEYPVIRPKEYDDFQIIGVLTGSCRRYR